MTVGLSRFRREPLYLLAGTALATLIVVDLSGLSEGEVERIWLPFVPWVATAVGGLDSDEGSPWLWLHAGTAFLLQMVLRSPW